MYQVFTLTDNGLKCKRKVMEEIKHLLLELNEIRYLKIPLKFSETLRLRIWCTNYLPISWEKMELIKVQLHFESQTHFFQGGITNEWMQIFARSLIDKKYLVEGDMKTYNLSDLCIMNSDYDEEYFRLFGRFFALIIFQVVLPYSPIFTLKGRVCPVKLVPSIFKKILKVPITFEDLQHFDRQQYLSLRNMKNLSDETLRSLEQYFEVDVTIQGMSQVHIWMHRRVLTLG